MKRVLLTVFAVLVAVGAAGYLAYAILGKETPPMQTGPPPGSISDHDLRKAAGTRVFFGHQSVGANVISGIPALYERQGVTPPDIVSSSEPLDQPAFFENDLIGSNGDPSGKLDDFQAIVRGGVGDTIDVAFMKFCYVDITAATDVPGLFEQYRTTMAELQQEYPDVTFLYVTTPLMTQEEGPKARVKAWLGRSTGAADNAARERFNALVREEYAESGRVIDLAAVESTTPDGRRVTGSHDGQTYYALYPGYASDPGHLNELGAETAAAEMLAVIADTRTDV